MRTKLLIPLIGAMLVVAVSQTLRFWMKLDHDTFGHGGWGFNFIRDTFDADPFEVVMRLGDFVEYGLIASLGLLGLVKIQDNADEN